MAENSDTGPEEHEPDYRFTLANERTFLAWQRTALGLLAAAVALVQLVPELTIPGARREPYGERAGNPHQRDGAAALASGGSRDASR